MSEARSAFRISPAALVGAAIGLAVALVAVYLALGGSSYAPSAVADPCAEREWRSPDGVEEAAEQFTLSALDGGACELGVSRETLALALATDESRERFMRERGIDDERMEEAVRAGLRRAIDDAERADALNPIAADAARAIAERVPVDEAIDLINDARSLFELGGGLLKQLGG